ncbi:MAG TPA: hypothetical protein VM344_06075 [Vitreimonas sp.]|nr:hypothetical protein [Vitreimonas sp.]
MNRRRVALGQGMYYLVSGLWPLVSMRTFERVTGPKTDHWLVRTVGLLAATIGGVLALRAVRAGDLPDEALGIASATGFAVTDVVHVARGVISPIYLADAIVECAIAAAWLVSRREEAAPRHRPASPS